MFDTIADLDQLSDFDFSGDVATSGSYEFANKLDLGSKQPLILKRHFVTQGIYPNDLFDSRTGNIDTWTDVDSATAFDVNAKLLVSQTDNDPNGSISGTYTINNGSGSAGTIITITKNSHGYVAGSFVVVDFTSGTGVDGEYQIQSVPDANSFVLTSATSISTSGNCTFGADFTAFNTFANGTFIGRGFRFKCEMTSDDPAQSIEIDQLGYSAELERRTENRTAVIASGTSQKAISFENSFFTGSSGTSISASSALPSIGISIENAQAGDTFLLSNISGTGFSIDIKNGSSFVDRNFRYTAVGFGRGS